MAIHHDDTAPHTLTMIEKDVEPGPDTPDPEPEPAGESLISLIGESPGGPRRDRGREPARPIDPARHPFSVGIPPG